MSDNNDKVEVDYTEIINNLEQQRDHYKQLLETSQGNELVLSRELMSYLLQEREALRGALENQ